MMMAMSAGTVSNYFLGMDIPLLKWIHLQTKRNELIRIFQLTYIYFVYTICGRRRLGRAAGRAVYDHFHPKEETP